MLQPIVPVIIQQCNQTLEQLECPISIYIRNLYQEFISIFVNVVTRRSIFFLYNCTLRLFSLSVFFFHSDQQELLSIYIFFQNVLESLSIFLLFERL